MKLFTGWVLAAGSGAGRDGGRCADARAQQGFGFRRPLQRSALSRRAVLRAASGGSARAAASIWLRIRAGRAGSAARGLQHHPPGRLLAARHPAAARLRLHHRRDRPRRRGRQAGDRRPHRAASSASCRPGRMVRTYEGAWNSSYGPPGPLPPTAVRGEPRPPASVPPRGKPQRAGAEAESAERRRRRAAPAKPAAPTRRQAAGRAVIAAGRGRADQAGRRRAG